MTLTPTQTYLWTAFSAHVSWVLAATFAAVTFGIAWYWGTLAILAVAVVKEVLIDPALEGNPLWSGTWDSGAGDLVGYLVGAAGVALYFLVTHHA